MKHALSFSASLLALLIVGCGGSGSSSPGSTTTAANLSNVEIEAIVTVQSTNLKHPTEWTEAQLEDPLNLNVKADLINPTVFGFQDPNNFQTGESYIFQLAGYQANGTRVVLPATFQSLDTSSTYGNLGTNSGAFSASNTTTTTAQIIIATYNGVSYQAYYQVKERQARVIGSVLLQTTNAAEWGATLDFYDAFGRLVGQVTSAVDGSFRASIPIDASVFTVDPHSLNSTTYPQAAVYNVFAFGGPIYSAGDPDCEAPLPSLSIGSQVLANSVFVVPAVSGASQPTTSGCPAGDIVVVHKATKN